MTKRNKGLTRGGILRVSPGIFNKYKQELIDQFGSLREGYCLYAYGDDEKSKSVPDALYWDGIPVVCEDCWELFDNCLGICTHRVLFHTPGIFGLAYDVKNLQQSRGLGMKMTQKMDPPENGRIYMQTDFKIGTFIFDYRHIVNACLIIPNDKNAA